MLVFCAPEDDPPPAAFALAMLGMGVVVGKELCPALVAGGHTVPHAVLG